MRGERQRSRQTGRAGADNENIDVNRLHDKNLCGNVTFL